MKTLIDIAVPGLTVILLVAVGMDLTAADFARVRRQPLLLLGGLLAPLVLLPPIAVALIRAFTPDVDVSAGILLIAACPIGGISNTWSYLARASTALSVTLTGLSCLFAGVTIPLVGAGLALTLGHPIAIASPSTALVVRLLLTLALPVGVGMWIRRNRPGSAERYRPALQRLAFVGIAVIMALVILQAPGVFVGELSTTVPLAAVFILCSMAAGWIFASLATTSRNDRFTIATEFGTRNVGIATAIAVTLLGRVEFARFATTYFLTELPIMVMAVWVFLKTAPRGADHGRTP